MRQLVISMTDFNVKQTKKYTRCKTCRFLGSKNAVISQHNGTPGTVRIQLAEIVRNKLNWYKKENFHLLKLLHQKISKVGKNPKQSEKILSMGNALTQCISCKMIFCNKIMRIYHIFSKIKKFLKKVIAAEWSLICSTFWLPTSTFVRTGDEFRIFAICQISS